MPLSTAAPLGRGDGLTQQRAESTRLNPAGAAARKPAPTGRFRAESKYKMSSEEDSPSLAWSLSALMSVSTYSQREKPQQVGFQASCFCLVMSILLKKTKMEKQAPRIHSIENEHEIPFRPKCSGDSRLPKSLKGARAQDLRPPRACGRLNTPAGSHLRLRHCSDSQHRVTVLLRVWKMSSSTVSGTDLSAQDCGLLWGPSSTCSRFDASGMSVSHSSFKCSFPLGTSSRVNHCGESQTGQPKPSWIGHTS